jgi:hypothetical protein
MRARLLLNIGLVLECQHEVQKAIENIQNVCRTSRLAECERLALLITKVAEISEPNFFETKGEHLNYSIPCFRMLSNTSLITPTKCTIFILYMYLLCFLYMFQCYVHHHQGEFCVLYLKPHTAIICGYYSSSLINIQRYSLHLLRLQ